MINYGNGFNNGMIAQGNTYQGSGLLNFNPNTNDINNNTNNTMGGSNNMLNYGLNQNQKKEENNYEPMVLNVEQQEFDGLLKTKLTTTTDVAKMVNRLFKPVFSDWEGCLILPNNAGGFDTFLYFKENGVKDPNKLTALEHVVQANTNNLTMSQRIQNLNLRYKNKTYELSRDAKDILKEFMPQEKNGKVKWNNFVVEKTQQEYNGYSVHVQITGVDIMKIIRKIYGAQVDGKRTDYTMKVERGIGVVNQQGFFANYLVTIMQLDVREVEKIAQSVGMIPLAGNIPMVK